MRTSLSLSPQSWQGLTLSIADHEEELPISNPSCEVASELMKLGGSVPVAVFLTALELMGYDDPHALVIEAIADSPRLFTWSAV